MKSIALSSLILALATTSAHAEGIKRAKAPIAEGIVAVLQVDSADENPELEPDDACYAYTEMTFKSLGDNKGTVDVEHKLHGACRLYVKADIRSYTIYGSDLGCGSRSYAGLSDDGQTEIRIADHRFRLCSDYAVNTVTAVTVSGATEVNYVSLKEASVSQQSLSGRLIKVSNIGGETTGYALATESALVEVDLSHVAHGADFLNKLIVAEGRYEVRYGVERPSYDVFVVTGLKVL